MGRPKKITKDLVTGSQKEIKAASTNTQENSPQEKESNLFKSTFRHYGNSMVGLREFMSRLGPVVTELQHGIAKERENRFKEIMDDFASCAKKEDFKEFRKVLNKMLTLTKNHSASSKRGSVQIKSQVVGECLLKLLKEATTHVREDIHRELLNRSILMSLVSYFEVLVSELAHAFYRIAPDSILTDDKVLSVKELKKFSSVDEALRFIVSHRVEELLWGDINDWEKFFYSRMKIDMKMILDNWAQFEEYFQRRHIMLHAGGHVTERYLSNVDWEKLRPYMNKPALGTKLDITDEYLENSINAFEICGLLLCQEVWRKLIPGDNEHRFSSDSGLLDVIYQRLLGRQWYVSEYLSAWGDKDPEASEEGILICKFNRWLSIKRQGRWSDVEKHVENFDCSAKNIKYSIARASLLEQSDEFFHLLPKVIGTDIPISALKEWPILDEMRNDPRFSEVLKKAEEAEPTPQK